MKKALVLIVALLVMALGLSVVSSAAPGVFVSSPSGNAAPELVKGEPEKEECKAELVITPYSERDELPDFLRQQVEAAYSEIVSAEDVADLTAAVEQLAQQLGIPVENLAVSDLFDIHYYNCNDHETHKGHFDIVLKSELLENFVCLLHRSNGQWHVVEGAKVIGNGDHLDFDAIDFSPFAIVVNTGASSDTPTGDAFNLALYIALALLSAAAVVYLCIKLKKQKAN